VFIGGLLDQGEAQSAASATSTPGGVPGGEGCQQPFPLVGGDAWTLILHADHDLLVVASQGDLHSAALGGMVKSITHQIAQGQQYRFPVTVVIQVAFRIDGQLDSHVPRAGGRHHPR